MKDFLPYKSYKLLDAAWILGQGSSGSTIRLRGPQEREYELRMVATSSRNMGQGDADDVFVRFTLLEAASGEMEEIQAALAAEQVRADDSRRMEERVRQLELQLSEARRRRESGNADQTAIRALESELAAARSRLSRTRSERAGCPR